MAGGDQNDGLRRRDALPSSSQESSKPQGMVVKPIEMSQLEFLWD